MKTTTLNIVELVKNTRKLFSYSGSKEQFHNHFKEEFEKNGNEKIEVGTYIEGFTGSLASLLIILQYVTPKKVVLNDLNKRLINLYTWIQKDPEKVWGNYEKLENKYQSLVGDFQKTRVYPKDNRDDIKDCENFYKHIRKHMNKDNFNDVNAACVLFTLNHQFNGLYNENKKGEFNVSFNWSTLDVNTQKIKENIFKLSELFNSQIEFVFETLDIDSLISKYNDHDTFIYLDPPYINTDIQYNKKRFKQENCFTKTSTHIKMLNSCEKYKYVMYSNNDHQDFQDYFKSYTNFSRKNTISNTKSSKSKLEILSLRVNTPVNNVDYVPETEDYSISIGTSFSGMDCPTYSLKKLGVNHTNEFVIDFDKWCRQTLIKNSNPKQVFSDITEVNTNELNPCDLYVWGSPCQDFSLSNNNRQGLCGEKSKLFFEGFRILKDLQPKYSIWENVSGTTSSNQGKDFECILEQFESLGNYDIQYKKINPVELGGNTTRIRMFVVLIRKDIGIKFNFPKKTISTKSIKDCLIQDNYKYLDKSEYISWNRPIEKQRGYLKKDFKYLGTKRQQDQRVFNINYPCPTIQRAGLVLINDGIGVRYLSPLELKKIQGFEEDMDMSHLSNSQIKKQLGNTMEVETMKKLLGEIVRIDKLHLFKQKKQKVKETLVS
jgi:DNA (cytosine-5)-methyltransferase 1